MGTSTDVVSEEILGKDAKLYSSSWKAQDYGETTLLMNMERDFSFRKKPHKFLDKYYRDAADNRARDQTGKKTLLGISANVGTAILCVQVKSTKNQRRVYWRGIHTISKFVGIYIYLRRFYTFLMGCFGVREGCIGEVFIPYFSQGVINVC